ncbi:hypothetical protein [Nostocoides sp.]|uniref:hypothetical protein n=1 Tax=Nostocoides sp. TaxID=1917966 RepID=UPI003BAE73F9
MHTKRTTTIASAIAATALTLSACGGSTATQESTAVGTAAGSASATATSPTAASPTSQEGGATVNLRDAKVGDEIDAVELGKVMSAVFTEGQTGHLAMDMGTIKAEGDFEVGKNGQQNSDLTMELGGSEMRIISVDGDSYMKGLFSQDKWIKSDAASVGAPDVNTFDPSRMAKAFGDIKAKVTAKEGDTTTYALELDLKKLFAAMETDLPTGMTLPDTIPVTYTLDGDGRLVKSTVSMGMEVLIEYSEWGKKVDIKAPPSSEITTIG